MIQSFERNPWNILNFVANIYKIAFYTWSTFGLCGLYDGIKINHNVIRFAHSLKILQRFFSYDKGPEKVETKITNDD